MSVRDEMIVRIVAAFPVRPIPPPSRIIEALPRDLERDDVRQTFGGKSWDEIPPDVLRYHAEALHLFLPEGWAYFAPAYMRATAWSYEESDMIPMIFPTTLRKYFREIEPFMTAPQLAVVREFLEWLLLTAPEHARRTDIESALQSLRQGPIGP